ncbi:hypothetical protein BH20ACT21_BH20ACT21_15490 [soil metagenome]|nr:hypothetical protein [Actinomycetota bacterium]
MRIDCSDCVMFRTEHCEDCLVTAVLHPPGTEVELDEELDSPLEVLSGVGLLPVLRFKPRSDGESRRVG